MAIIRSKRLFLTYVPPVPPPRDHVSTPDVGNDLTPRYAQDLYTCPAGYRAILRTTTMVLGSLPEAGAEPEANLAIRRDDGYYPFRWVRFVDYPESVATWVLTDAWDGMVVLHAGETFMCDNKSTVLLFVTGSGHELPEQT